MDLKWWFTVEIKVKLWIVVASVMYGALGFIYFAFSVLPIAVIGG